MTSIDLLSRCRADGVELWVDGGSLCYRARRSVLTTELLTDLRTHKAELLATLIAPGERHRPLDIDHQLAEMYGLDGSRREFLGAAALVAHFDGESWPEHEALEDLRKWWGRDLQTLTATEWIVSAAHADDVRAMALRGSRG